MVVIIELLSVLEIIGVNFDYELTISKLISYSDSFAFLNKLNSFGKIVLSSICGIIKI